LTINAQGTYNTTLFKTDYQIDECDHSNLELKVYPQQVGEYYIHVLIGNQELKKSPFQVKINKSDKHKALDEDALNQQKLDKEAAAKAKAAKLQALKDKEANKLLMQKKKEETLAKKRADTEQRSKDALNKAKEASLAEQQRRAEERRMRKENRCGGGFKLPPK